MYEPLKKMIVLQCLSFFQREYSIIKLLLLNFIITSYYNLVLIKCYEKAEYVEV